VDVQRTGMYCSVTCDRLVGGITKQMRREGRLPCWQRMSVVPTLEQVLNCKRGAVDESCSLEDLFSHLSI